MVQDIQDIQAGKWDAQFPQQLGSLEGQSGSTAASSTVSRSQRKRKNGGGQQSQASEGGQEEQSSVNPEPPKKEGPDSATDTKEHPQPPLTKFIQTILPSQVTAFASGMMQGWMGGTSGASAGVKEKTGEKGEGFGDDTPLADLDASGECNIGIEMRLFYRDY